MTSQRLVEEFAAWLYRWDTGRVGGARIPDHYLNEAASFLASELGQRLQHGDREQEQQLQARVDATWKAGQ